MSESSGIGATSGPTPGPETLPTPERLRPPTSGSFDRHRAIEAGRKSAEARRRRREEATPHRSDSEGVCPSTPERFEAGTPAVEARARPQDFGTSGIPWTIEAARQAAVDPKTPAYVAQRAREWLHEQEEKLAARSVPELSGVPGRGVNLSDVLALAAAVGLDLDDLVKEARARASAVESF